MSTTALILVSPFHENILEDGYRTCDFCDQSATDDIWEGRLQEAEWRKFYLIADDSGLCVCENCLVDGEIPAEPQS